MNAGLLEDFVNAALHWELIFRNCRDLLLAESNEWILFELCQELSTVLGSFFFFWTIHLKSNYFFLTSAVALISDYCFYLQPLLTGYYKKKSFPVLFQFFHIDGKFPGGFYSKFLGVFILKFETFKCKLFWRVRWATLSKYKSRKKLDVTSDRERKWMICCPWSNMAVFKLYLASHFKGQKRRGSPHRTIEHEHSALHVSVLTSSKYCCLICLSLY